MENGHLTKVVYAEPGTETPPFQRSAACLLPVADIVVRLRQAIEAAGLRVPHVIDPQALLSRGGHEIGPARHLLFFHPKLMAQLLAANPNALLETPLKLAVLGFPGGDALVRWTDPATAFARYGNPALASLGQELGAACEQIVASGLGSGATKTQSRAVHASGGRHERR